MYKLVNSLFFDRFYSNLFILIQLAICIGFGNYAICINNGMYKGCDTTYVFENAEYYSAITTLLDTKLDFDFLEEKNCEVEFIPNNIKREKTNIVSYEKNTLNLYKEYLKKGQWITDTDKVDGVINCLVVYDTSMLGKTIQCLIANKTRNFYVCGVLSKNCKNITKCSADAFLTPSEIFVDYDFYYTNIICDYQDVSSFVVNNYTNAMVFLDGNHYEEYKQYLSHYGVLLTMENIRNNIFSTEYSKIITTYSYVAYGVGVLGLVSMMCMLILNIAVHEDDFYTLSKFGLQKKHLAIVCLYYSLFMILLLLFLSFISYCIWFAMCQIPFSPIFNYKNIIFNLVGVLLIIAMIFLVFFNRLYKKVELNE